MKVQDRREVSEESDFWQGTIVYLQLATNKEINPAEVVAKLSPPPEFVQKMSQYCTKKAPEQVLKPISVTRQGIEPWTPTLRVSCSTS